jgi:hypothetical protein
MSYALPLITAAWSMAVRAIKSWIAPRTRQMLLGDSSDEHESMRQFLYAWVVDADSVMVAPSVFTQPHKQTGRVVDFVPGNGTSHSVLARILPCSSASRPGDVRGVSGLRAHLRCASARILATSSSPFDRLIAATAWLFCTSRVVICVTIVGGGEDRDGIVMTASSALLRGDVLVDAMRALVDLAVAEFKRDNPDKIHRTLSNMVTNHVAVRPLSTIVMDAATRCRLVDGITQFKSATMGALYARIGRPRKLCILIRGPPGTGKSSALPALCTLFGATRMHSYSTCSDFTVRSASASASSRPIMIVFEDIDRSFVDLTSGEPKVALGPLLELLDGVHCGAGDVLIVLTANDVDALPSVLRRPGRVDMDVEFGFATEAMVAEYAGMFFVGAISERQCADIAALLLVNMGPRLSLAQVQAFMFEHRESPDAMLRGLRSGTPL